MPVSYKFPIGSRVFFFEGCQIVDALVEAVTVSTLTTYLLTNGHEKEESELFTIEDVAEKLS